MIVDPRDAQLDLRGTSLDFRAGDRIFVRPGRYVLIAAHAGYETAQLPVQVSGKPDEQVRLTLRKLPGEVHVQAGDVEASLVIDGKPIGRVPGAYRVAAGKHQFRVAAPHYQEFIANVTVKGLGQKQTVTFKLKPLFSPVTIESDPAGARVALDGKDIGVTPLTAQIDAGNYALSLVAQGFRPWESSIQVKAETPQKIGPVKLGLPDGTLSIRSSPSQADVAVAGRYRGRTPLDVSLPPGVEYEIAINHAGYEPARRVVAVKAGERSGMEMTLKPILGEVNVRGDPADAQLFVDGQARGSANQTIMLPSTGADTRDQARGLSELHDEGSSAGRPGTRGRVSLADSGPGAGRPHSPAHQDAHQWSDAPHTRGPLHDGQLTARTGQTFERSGARGDFAADVLPWRVRSDQCGISPVSAGSSLRGGPRSLTRSGRSSGR